VLAPTLSKFQKPSVLLLLVRHLEVEVYLGFADAEGAFRFIYFQLDSVVQRELGKAF
jgi:hypothetical protein